MNSEETHALTCGLVESVLFCRIRHATNPMKYVFRVLLQLHFEADKFYNIPDTNKVVIYEAPISMDENDDLFQCLRE